MLLLLLLILFHFISGYMAAFTGTGFVFHLKNSFDDGNLRMYARVVVGDGGGGGATCWLYLCVGHKFRIHITELLMMSTLI